MTQGEATVCLNMIVKNESKVIRRCLTSVKPLIDHWVIVDTGSTDDTKEIILEFMKDTLGELHQRNWINFAHNRNEALALAKGKGEYILLIDADEILEFDEGFKLTPLNLDYYDIVTKHSGSEYTRIQLIKDRLNWKWTGVLHEYIGAPEALSHAILKGVYDIYGHDGCRSQDPLKFQKDAMVFEEAMKTDPYNSRYQFYLAQSYKDAHEYKLAITNYKKRIGMGGFDQEVFWSMLQVGLLQELLQKPEEIIVNGYREAYKYRPTRAEPLYRLTEYYRRSGNYVTGYLTAREGLQIKLPNDHLFVERWIYDYGMLFEFSICAYWTDEFLEAKFASELLLTMPELPPEIREYVEKNLIWIHTKKDFN
jgi:glycosyltransferase involved in cell wall biosynthesis